jgi:hypothetical protein
MSVSLLCNLVAWIASSLFVTINLFLLSVNKLLEISALLISYSLLALSSSFPETVSGSRTMSVNKSCCCILWQDICHVCYFCMLNLGSMMH